MQNIQNQDHVAACGTTWCEPSQCVYKVRREENSTCGKLCGKLCSRLLFWKGESTRRWEYNFLSVMEPSPAATAHLKRHPLSIKCTQNWEKGGPPTNSFAKRRCVVFERPVDLVVCASLGWKKLLWWRRRWWCNSMNVTELWGCLLNNRNSSSEEGESTIMWRC
jgi:hypothetical protein